MAASEAAKEAVHLGAFMSEVDEQLDSALELSVDNKAAIDLAYNPEHHQRTKHILTGVISLHVTALRTCRFPSLMLANRQSG